MFSPTFILSTLSALLACAGRATAVDPDACPGYTATNVRTLGPNMTADLVLAGPACNIFGPDVQQLTLEVVYETDTRIHVKITDPATPRYEVPDSVLPRPSAQPAQSPGTAQIQFNYTAAPFSFTIFRSSTEEVLFSTATHALVFEPQYLRLKTALPAGANVYGLGEHTDAFRLPPDGTTRTLWSRDAFGVPPGTNLYGNHPVYFEHRTTGTHAVFLRSSSGMDVKLGGGGLEYNVIGGVLDLYFLAGSETDPAAAARQYAEVVGTPAEVPYWAFGLHQCRYGYTDFVAVANVITNYSAAGIPLETMWTDIDYMHQRWIFTNDAAYFPTARMRDIVDYLHAHDQQYVLMTDPAIAYQPNNGYETYDRAAALDLFLKSGNGSASLGVVWPGVTVFPDWFHPDTQSFWTSEYARFFDPTTGIDIDGAWIDMNEPSSFCDYPCTDPFASAAQQGLPPTRGTSPPDPNAHIFGGSTPSPSNRVVTTGGRPLPGPMAVQLPNVKRQHAGDATNSSARAVTLVLAKRQHAGDNVLNPPYAIANALPALSSRTAYTNAVHANGLIEYDTHNLFGTMMSTATRSAMLARRPGLRPLVITRSTFAGAGRATGKWLGDNMSAWADYRVSIAGILGMAAVFQVPMVGADICGYGGSTTEELCARWATLGAFYPFMRNHNSDTSPSQEFYLWPSVTQAAKNALETRFRLLDYIYTAFHLAHTDGTPVLSPMWFKYPTDENTFGIDLQFFYGDALLVSPVTDQGATSVNAYFPDDIFYALADLAPMQGHGASVTLADVNTTAIPVHIRGGSVLPLRVHGAVTTRALRSVDFELLVAPDTGGSAAGALYVDDGVSVEQNPGTATDVRMSFADRALSVSGTFGAPLGVNMARASFLGVASAPQVVNVDGVPANRGQWSYDAAKQLLVVQLGFPFNGPFDVSYS